MFVPIETAHNLQAQNKIVLNTWVKDVWYSKAKIAKIYI